VQEGREFAIWLRKAYLAFHRRVNAWMLKHGITADQYVVLRSAVLNPGATQIEIVQRVASDPNTVAAILRLLEQRGLVRREAHARDARARCVFPTPAGRRLERRAYKDSEPLRAALRGCTTEHNESLEFLQRIHQVFSAPPAEANGRPQTRASSRKAGR
jgi:DNA-binding MarR family transcriptional regulator